MKIKEEKLFVYIFLIVGVLFTFLTPPFLSPDEGSHFKRTYMISKGHLYPTTKNEKLGDYFPKEMRDYIADSDKFMGNRDDKYSYDKFVWDQVRTMSYDPKVFLFYSTVKVPPIAYFVPASGMVFSKVIAKILRLEDVTYTYMLYFARLFSLFFSAFILYWAIKITPCLKKTMFTVALIPMATFLCSMLSYDNLVIPISLLAAAIILDLIFNEKTEKITWKQITILSIIGIILLNVKVVYFLIFLLMFFVPKKKYGNGKTKDVIKTWAIALGAILGGTLLLKLPYFLINAKPKEDPLFYKQLAFILSHPIKYIQILVNNIITQRGSLLIGLVGALGLIDTYLPISMIGLFLLYLPIFAFIENSQEKIQISFKMKILLLVHIVFSIIGIFTYMYLDWTTNTKIVGGPDILGVQGRYFLPLVFPCCLLLSNKRFKGNKIFKNIINNYYLVPCLMLVVSVSMIIIRYWG